MIICYIGTVGGGKTISMTHEAYQYHLRGFTVYANYGLNFPHVRLTKRVFDEMIAHKEQLQDAVICIDEVHIWLDSRSSMQKKNKAITYFVLQTRKRNVRLLVTTQHMHQIDKRLRDTVDIITYCKNLSNQSSVVKSGQTHIMQESLYQWKDNQRPKMRVLNATPLYDLYDTREIIDMNDENE